MLLQLRGMCAADLQTLSRPLQNKVVAKASLRRLLLSLPVDSMVSFD